MIFLLGLPLIVSVAAQVSARVPAIKESTDWKVEVQRSNQGISTLTLKGGREAISLRTPAIPFVDFQGGLRNRVFNAKNIFFIEVVTGTEHSSIFVARRTGSRALLEPISFNGQFAAALFESFELGEYVVAISHVAGEGNFLIVSSPSRTTIGRLARRNGAYGLAVHGTTLQLTHYAMSYQGLEPFSQLKDSHFGYEYRESVKLKDLAKRGDFWVSERIAREESPIGGSSFTFPSVGQGLGIFRLFGRSCSFIEGSESAGRLVASTK